MRSLERPESVVVEGRVFPGFSSGAVTSLTAGGKAEKLVVGICRVLKIGKMTAHAFRRTSGIDSVRMAVYTVRQEMLAGEDERIMVEHSPFPCFGKGPVTGFTGIGETGKLVVRIRSVLEVCQMAAHALRGTA